MQDRTTRVPSRYLDTSLVAVTLALSGCSLLPSADDIDAVSEELGYVQGISEELRVGQEACSDSSIVLVDMNSDFGDADLEDGVHPTREGAEKMADRWLECILSF